jgi:hypothetical protein
MNRNKLTTILASCIICACLMIMNSCKKGDVITTPVPALKCLVNGVADTATNISVGNIQGYTAIKAISKTTTPALMQEIIIELSSNATGTYPLNAYNSTSSIGAAFLIGTSETSLTGYQTTGVSPYVGNIVITSSANNVVSGTFSFIGTDGSNYYAITNGTFTNVTL